MCPGASPSCICGTEGQVVAQMSKRNVGVGARAQSSETQSLSHHGTISAVGCWVAPQQTESVDLR